MKIIRYLDRSRRERHAVETAPGWLKAGDQVSIEIDRIGVLANPVANETLVTT